MTDPKTDADPSDWHLATAAYLLFLLLLIGGLAWFAATLTPNLGPILR